MATFATSAEWYDYIYNLTTLPELGFAYLKQAPIFAAFGKPVELPAGQLRNNWSDGGTATYISTSTYAGTGTITKVNDSTSSNFVDISAPAQNDRLSKHSGNAGAFEMSLAGAAHNIYDKFVYECINGNNTGQIHGFDTYLTTVSSTPVSTATTVSGVESTNFLETLYGLEEQMEKDGGGFILTSSTGLASLKTKMATAGGITPVHEGLRNFGFGNYLEFDGYPVFSTRHLTTVGASDEYFYFVNTGPMGCKLVVPFGLPTFDLDGPKKQPLVDADWYDMILTCQLIYRSPRAVGRAQITMS